MEENHVYNSEEQMEIEKVMEETRRKEIEMFRKKKNKEKDTSLKRKATAMDNEEDSDDDCFLD